LKEVIFQCQNYDEVFASASKVVVVSKYMYKILLDLGCPENKLVYNVYGPRPEFHEIKPNYNKEQFIAVGRFVDKKAPYYTIVSFNKVVQKYPEARLLMAGNGELLNTCKNLVKYLGLEHNVKFLGVISQEELRKLLENSIGFVQHSIRAESGDMEGTPLAILEASAAGLAVIATNHAGIPDVIIHEQTGLLCEEHDVEAMSNNMLRLLDDVAFAKQLGQKGKVHILEFYSMKRHISKLDSVLLKALT
jgi:glycosyltransferase involved in cell wall biosynthesis